MATPPTTPQRHRDAERRRERERRTLDSPQLHRTPQQHNLQAIPFNLQHQNPAPQPLNNNAPDDPFVDVDMDGNGLRLTQGIAAQVAALPPLPVFRQYGRQHGPNPVVPPFVPLPPPTHNGLDAVQNMLVNLPPFPQRQQGRRGRAHQPDPPAAAPQPHNNINYNIHAMVPPVPMPQQNAQINQVAVPPGYIAQQNAQINQAVLPGYIAQQNAQQNIQQNAQQIVQQNAQINQAAVPPGYIIAQQNAQINNNQAAVPPIGMPQPQLNPGVPLPQPNLLNVPALANVPNGLFPFPAIGPAANAVIQLPHTNLPPAYLPVNETLPRYQKINLGRMDVLCQKCQAWHWSCERKAKTSAAHPKFGTCCLDGKVTLPAMKKPPRELRDLYEGQSLHSSHFLEHIVAYNNAFALVSISHKPVHFNTPGPDVYTIEGELRHRMGALLPPNDDPLYAQVYFQTNEKALEIRLTRTAYIEQQNNNNQRGQGRRELLQILQDVLHRHHGYVALYKTALERLQQAGNPPDLKAYLHFNPGQDQRRYNLPTADEVAVIIPGNEYQATTGRDMIVELKSGPLKRISEINPAFQSLYYVLLFPHGEHGWHRQIPLNLNENEVFNMPEHHENEIRHAGEEPAGEEPDEDDENENENNNRAKKTSRKNVSQLEYYAYRLHKRRNESDHLFRAKALFQRYIVDGWAQTDQSRLFWLENNQGDLRVDVLQGFVDAVAAHGDVDLAEMGQRIILPSSYIGGSRHMFQLYQDSLALARFFAKPDFFLTVTANPRWEEITRELLPGQQPSDRPDLITRVFREKVKILLKKIKDGMLGEFAGDVYTIEFQKRGLPHIHILIFLKREAKERLNDPEIIDKLISAEIPDPVTQPRLHRLVTTLMVHKPCEGKENAACQKDGKCSKHYPKQFQEQTTLAHDGYTIYRRRNNGRTFTLRDGTVIDNRNIVPYCPMILLLMESHANLECCISIKAFKYIHKYVYKGHDRTTMGFGQTENEIKQYLDARYVSASEACWRLFRYRMHEEYPGVVRLAVHLPNQQSVFFNETDNVYEIVQNAASRDTTLTAFFKFNKAEEEEQAQNPIIGPQQHYARGLLYQEFPQKYVWNKATRKWKLRERGFAIGRMYFAHPTSGERFYLRTLLTVVRGPTSFENLKKFNGEDYPTFKAACFARGLLEDDSEWKECLREAAEIQTGYQLQMLFVTILRDCNPTSPLELWNGCKEHICDISLRRRMQDKGLAQNPTNEELFDYGLYLIDKELHKSGKSLKDFPPMPLPSNQWADAERNRLLADQLAYNHDEQRTKADQQIPLLNPEQRNAFNLITDAALNQTQKMFFLNGPAGTGKTFCYNTICYHLRAEAKIVLCAASSGIAALLIIGGRTAHSTFKIPLDIYDGKACNVKKGTHLAELLGKTDLIIWDEVPMQDRLCQEAVDLTLRDIKNRELPFGGVPVVFGGDFQQILPVVTKGGREQIVGQCLQRSKLWRDIQIINLTQNMRLDGGTDEERQFAQWLLDVGHGRATDQTGKVKLPDSVNCGNTVEDLIGSIYPGLALLDPTQNNDQYFLERTILTSRNDNVEKLNDDILQRLKGDEIVFNSADSVVTERGVDADVQYPLEYLNSINCSGLPVSKLKLKIGAPIMILRNIDPAHGLCNGARAILTKATRRVLEVRLLGGEHAGRKAFIPRITLTPAANAGLPFTLQRRQFPVRLAFAMTINKSQGQSVKNVGLDLRTEVFTHGQLYVALSRCTSSLRIKAIFKEGAVDTSTANIVYPEVLLD